MTRLAALSLVLVFAVTTSAQSPTTGFPPFGSFQESSLDSVNLQNLNFAFPFPLVSAVGRGLGFRTGLAYNSLAWMPNGGSPNTWTMTGGWPALGSLTPIGQTTWRVHTTPCPLGGVYNVYDSYAYQDPLGTVHQFGVAHMFATFPCTSSVLSTGYSKDGSGYYIDISSVTKPIVYSPDGTKIDSVARAATDSNGNSITYTYVSSSESDWKDTLGQTALKVVTGSTTTTISYLDPSGNYQAITFNLQAFNIATNFACSGIAEYTGTMTLPTSIQLPNGQQYSFAYELTSGSTTTYTGRISQITLPTGGTIQYQYTGANDGVNCADGSILGLNRTVSDGTNSATWQYSRALNTPSTGNTTTTVTAPKMPYDSAANQSMFVFDSYGHETSAKIYSGAATGTPLRTTNTTWTSGLPTSRTTILEDGQTQSQLETTYDTSQAPVNGNILTLKEHDWGSGTPGPILRTTNFAYLSGSSYSAVNLIHKVTTKTISDQSGTVKYRIDVAYDQGGSFTGSNCITGAAQHDDTNYGCSYITRGLPTSVTTYSNASAQTGAVTKAFTFDSLGNPRTAQLDCCQLKTWNYSAATQFAYPDSVVSGSSPGPQLTTSFSYYLGSGQEKSEIDPNGQTTSFTYDVLKRPTSTTRPDGTVVSVSYNDAAKKVTVSTPVQGSSQAIRTTVYDTLGRPITVTLADNAGTTYSSVATQYDPLSRGYMGSNPYTSTPSNWTTTQFDAVGRPTKVILPDGISQTTYSYATNTAAATDPAGKQKKNQVDALGHLTKAFEDPSGLNYETDYTYNTLDLLTGVTQGVQTRAYAFDDLGRVTSVKTPETNQVAFSYQYNNFGLVTQRTDARGVISTYGYEGLNRLTSVSYNVGSSGVPATPSVSLAYGIDSSCNAAHGAGCIGLLITMTDGVGSENYTYNNLGELTNLQKAIGTTTYPLSYAYNLAGELNSITYPSGRVVQQNLDTIGRLSSIVGTFNSINTTYASGFLYNSAQQVTGFNYGNNINAAFGYTSDLLLLSCLDYSTTTRNGTCTHDGTTNLGLTYSYPAAGSNNGQISGITDNSGTQEAGRSVTFSYDALYRLSSAVTTGSTNYPKWHLTWGYDRYGNRLNQTVQSDTSPNLQPPPPGNSLSFANPGGAQTNRPDNMCFDANGNLMTETSVSPCPPSNPTYTYDAENRLVNYLGSSATYTFDGNGLRVKKAASGTTTVYIFSGSKVIAEYDNGAMPSSPSREYIYSGGPLLAKIESGATTYFHSDHLSMRMLTDSSGNVLSQRGHYPFGEQWYAQNTTTKWQFTSYEHDSESTNDYAMARTYINRFGRFPSTDPVPGSIGNPQSLNGYPYALNDPVNLADPSGAAVYPADYYLVGSTAGEGVNFGSNWNEFDLLTGSTVLKGFWVNWHINIDPESVGDAEMVTDSIEPVYGGLLFDPGDPQGPGGGNNQKKKEKKNKKPTCFAELKFNSNPARYGAPAGATHSFWYVQDTSGNQYIVTAGPTNTGAGGNYGALNVWGPNTPITESTKNSGANKASDLTHWSTGSSPDNCDAVAKLLAAARAFPNNSIPYNPLGPNSNSAAAALGHAAGLNPTAPPGAWGWSLPIGPP